MISNYLDISSVLKLLVARAVCVLPKFEHTFSMHSSPALKVIITSVKRVRLQCRKCSSPAQNAFVSSDK